MASSDENARMLSQRLDKIEDKIDDVRSSINNIEVIAARQAVLLDGQHNSLVEHIRRTELLEGKVEPMEKKWAMLHGALKLIGLVSLLIEAYHYLKG